MNAILPFAIFVIFLLANTLKILQEYEKAAIYRMGRLVAVRGPGLVLVIPFLEKIRRVDLRTITMEVPFQNIITRDKVSIKISAIVDFRVVDVSEASSEVENYLYATSQLAQITVSNICGDIELAQLLVDREKISQRLREVMDTATRSWGVHVSKVGLKDIDHPGGKRSGEGSIPIAPF